MTCPACEGHVNEAQKEAQKCEHCQSGLIRFTACPLDVVTPDVWEAIEMARLFAKGIPPIAGGSLDQTAVFLQAARFVWAEESQWKSEAMTHG